MERTKINQLEEDLQTQYTENEEIKILDYAPLIVKKTRGKIILTSALIGGAIIAYVGGKIALDYLTPNMSIFYPGH